jgi:hypothetical protein
LHSLGAARYVRRVKGVVAMLAVLALAAAGGATAAQHAKHPKHSQFAMRLPPARHVSVQFVRLRVTGRALAHAPKRMKLQYASSAAAKRRGVMLAAVYSKKTKKFADYVILAFLLNPGAKTVAAAGDEPVDKVYIGDKDIFRLLAFVFTGIDPGELEHEHSYFFAPSGKRVCISCYHVQGEEVTKVDQSADRLQFWKDLEKASPIVWGNPADDAVVKDLDTGHYDDGHSFGWKRDKGDAEWLKDATQLLHGSESSVDGLVDDLYRFAGYGKTPPPPLGTYTCAPPSESKLIFDNFNVAVVDNGGNQPSFTTAGGGPFCIDQMATYHWNDGKGAPVGTIWLTSSLGQSGPWTMSGQNPDGSPGTINWIGRPADPAKAIVQGSVTCHDSAPATWAQNEESGHKGFCRVWGRPATKTG